MSESELIIDEQTLLEVADELNSYIFEYRDVLESAIRKLKLNSEDWNDEDFNSLLSAINSFTTDVDNIETCNNQLVNRIRKKIEEIHRLHSLKV